MHHVLGYSSCLGSKYTHEAKPTQIILTSEPKEMSGCTMKAHSTSRMSVDTYVIAHIHTGEGGRGRGGEGVGLVTPTFMEEM